MPKLLPYDTHVCVGHISACIRRGLGQVTKVRGPKYLVSRCTTGPNALNSAVCTLYVYNQCLSCTQYTSYNMWWPPPAALLAATI